MKDRKPTELRPAYQSPFRIRRDWKAILTSNLGLTVLGALAVLVAVVVVISADSSDPQRSAATTQNLHVIDGDTLDVDGRRIRLSGIDAPELGQPCSRNDERYDCGKAAQEHLTYLLTGEHLVCAGRSQDKWGRELATCQAGDKDIARLMVRHGWAVAYTDYSTAYVADEEFARNNGMGL